MWRVFVLLILILPAACTWVPSASDPENIALITALEGKPKVLRDGISFDVEPGVALKLGDVVLTTATDRISLRMQDGTLITLASKGELVFHYYGEGESGAQLRLSMGQGDVRLSPAGSLVKKPGGIDLVTPMALVRIDAGEALVSVDGMLRAQLISKGSVTLRNNRGEARLQRPRQASTVLIGQAPQKPVTLGSAETVNAVRHLRR